MLKMFSEMNIAYESFTPLASLAGGILIGLSATMTLLLLGRVAGISGILGGLLGRAAPGDVAWRAAFLGGMLAGGLAMHAIRPDLFVNVLGSSTAGLVLAGLFVGFGTRLGSGCTSGHGVCGISRGSLRSLAATATFMATGIATAFVVQHLLGGNS
jgi:uncharacterized protein